MGTGQDPSFIAEISGHGVGAIFLFLVGKARSSAQPWCYEGSSGGNSENCCLSPGQSQVSLNNYPHFCSRKEKKPDPKREKSYFAASMGSKQALPMPKSREVMMHHLPPLQDWGGQCQAPMNSQGGTPAPSSSPAAPRLRRAKATLYPPAPSPQYLRALDVIVQVVPERVDQVYGVVSGGSIGVTGEQH